MTTTLAFDVYGTLIDPFGISAEVKGVVGDKTGEFTGLWRDKQIEYLFRRALGRDYQPFSVCTAQALDYACASFRITLTSDDRTRLLDKYRELPAYDEVADSLRELKKAGCRSYAFSNGEPGDLAALLGRAGLIDSLDGIVSVHDVKSFKPDPEVYRHFNQKTGASPTDTWLVSGNPFDIIGGHKAGWRTAWVRRDPSAVFDPWDIQPTVTVENIGDLIGRVEAQGSGP